MSHVPFRQGVVRYSTAGDDASFVDLNGANASLLASTEFPFSAAFAHGPTNYLVTFIEDVTNAWIGIPNATSVWLYIDISPLNANITYGHTTIAPTFGPTAPGAPVQNQLWFNTTNATMYVRQGALWVEKVRLVVAHVTNLGIVESVSDQYPQFYGTTVGNNTPTPTGFILFDAATGNALRRLDGSYTVFATTEDRLATRDPSGASVKLASVIVEAVATQPLTAYTVVKFTDFNEISPADAFTASLQPFGLIEETTSTGETVRVVMEGVIFNPSWSWPTINALLYSNATGTLTLTPLIPNQAPVAIVIDANTILMRAPELTVTNISAMSPSDASTTVKGITKLSVPPVSATNPIAVGDNDSRMTLAANSLQLTGGTMLGTLDMGGFGIINLLDGVNPTDAINLGQLTTAINNISFDYLDPKDPVRVATTVAIDLAAPGTTIDGVTMAVTNRVLVKDGSTVNSGTTSIDNGIYVWNGAAVPMTRATDADTSSEVVTGMYTLATEGTTNANRGYILQTPAPITLGFTPLTFVFYNTSSALTAGTGLTINMGVIYLDANLDDLNDVTVPTPAVNDVLTWNGTAWVNLPPSGAFDLDDLNDVVITAPTNGQVLVYNQTLSQWENSSAFGSNTLAGLNDVNVATVDDRDLIFWNTAAQKWLDVSLPELGINIEQLVPADAPTVGGVGGIAIGAQASAGSPSQSYDYALAVGYGASARDYGVAIGKEAGAPADYSIAIGENAAVEDAADNSIAIGRNANITSDSNPGGLGVDSIAIGHSALVSVENATMIGYNLENDTQGSVKLGQKLGLGPTEYLAMHLRTKGRLYLEGESAAYQLPTYSTAQLLPSLGGEPSVAGGLAFDSDTNKPKYFDGVAWVGFSSVGALDDLTDVTITAPLPSHVLFYNGVEWVNGFITTSSISNFATAVNTLIGATSIDVHIDVDTTTVPPVPGDILSWNGTNWVPGGSSLDSLSDVVIGAPNPGDILFYDGVNWINQAFAETYAIDELTDVDTTTLPPSIGQFLKWDGTNWVPGSLTAGDLPVLQVYDFSGASEGNPNADEIVLNFVAVRDFTIPANMVGSRARVQTATTSTSPNEWVFDIQLNGVSFATVSFDSAVNGGLVGTFSASLEQNITGGDVITVVAPNPIPDLVLADLAITIKASTVDVLGLIDLAMSTPGIPASGLLIMNYVCARDLQIETGFLDSQAFAQTAATALTTFDIRNNGVSFASLDFAAAAQVGSFTVSTPALMSFLAGDVLTIVAPVVPDATLADIAVTIRAVTL